MNRKFFFKLPRQGTTTIIIGAALVLFSAFGYSDQRVALKTDHGTIVIELYTKEAPITVANFLAYVDSKFYDGTIFHRVVPGFVVQGGGMTFDFASKPTRDPIKNESDNGLKNDYKTVAMARTDMLDSATSQFYININNNNALDGSGGRLGYTVFGKVVEGMDAVEKIAAEPVGMYRAFPDAPNYAVRILSAFRVDQNFKPESSTTNKSEINNPLKNSTVSDALVRP
jgi:peptidyl-prolyl cis-trans isomerase A (cyclophilin A)